MWRPGLAKNLSQDICIPYKLTSSFSNEQTLGMLIALLRNHVIIDILERSMENIFSTGFQFSKSDWKRGWSQNGELWTANAVCCIISDQTKLWTPAFANWPRAEADQQTKCGKCKNVINVTVIVQFFRFQSKFKRWLLYFKKVSI